MVSKAEMEKESEIAAGMRSGGWWSAYETEEEKLGGMEDGKQDGQMEEQEVKETEKREGGERQAEGRWGRKVDGERERAKSAEERKGSGDC